MRWQNFLAIPVLMAVFLGLCSSPVHVSAAPPDAGDRLTVSGVMADAQGKGVKEVAIELLVNGRQVTPQGRDERIETGGKGGYIGRYRLPRGTLPEAAVQVRALRPSWQTQESEIRKIVEAGTDAAGNRLFQVQADLTLRPLAARTSSGRQKAAGVTAINRNP